ncbi:MAG: fatty acid desaturase family protein [Burkholderiales bacterium]|jgi:fatty acid desaturase
MSSSSQCPSPSSVAPVHALSEAEDAELRRRSNLMGVWLVLHAWGLIALAMVLCAMFPNPLTVLLGIVIVGNRQLGLAILMHDAAHRLLFASAGLNDRVGHWLCGAPVGASLAAYRPYHLSHHRHTQQAGDPDLALSAPFPISRSSFRRKTLRDLSGITGYQRRVAQFKVAMQGASGPIDALRRLLRNEGPFLATNLALLGALALAGQAWLYFVLWLLPLLTWYQWVSRVRNIAEHALVGSADDPLRNTRTTLAGPLMRLLVAPYWVNYHLEHHLFVFTPCWKLPRAHRLLVARGLAERMEIGRGYLEVLRRATSRIKDDGPSRPRPSTPAQI